MKLVVIIWLASWGFSFYFPGTLLGGALGMSGAVTLAFISRQQNLQTSSYLFWFFAGFLFYLTVMPWMPSTIWAYYYQFDLPTLVVVLVYIASAGILALQFPFALWMFRYLPAGLRLEQVGLRLPIAWCAAELLFYTPLPWFFGNLLLALTPLAQLADLLGVPLVSFAALWLASLTVQIFVFPRRASQLVLFLAVTISILLYSSYRETAISREIEQAKTVRIGLIQGNDELNPEKNNEITTKQIQTYLRLSSELRPQPELIVWPEVSVPWMLEESAEFDLTFGLDAPAVRRPLLFSAYTPAHHSHLKKEFFQISALMLYPDGRLSSEYQKRRTLPFAEDIPFKQTFPWLIKIFGERNFLPGTSDLPVIIQRPIGRGGTLSGAPYSVATLICYEDILPDLFRRTVRDHRVDLLVGMSNSQWFGTSIAAQQHALLSAWRAIENGRFFVRAATVGVTQVVDPRGRILARLEPFQTGAMVSEVPLLHSNTIYTTIGDAAMLWFSLLTLITTLLCYYLQKRSLL